MGLLYTMKYSKRFLKKTNKTRKTRKNRKGVRKNKKLSRLSRRKRGGEPKSGNWVNPQEIDTGDVCAICTESFSPDKATYKTSCGHTFHNDCLNAWCEKTFNMETQNTPCPICRTNISGEDLYDCMDVWAFKNKSLGRGDGNPYFSNVDLQNIYDQQPE
jgi:hypothetical protein